MSGSHDDRYALLAEREYLRDRSRHLRAELQQTLDAVGTGLTSERVTDVAMEQLRDEYVSALQRTGNSELAQRWLDANGAWEAAQAHLGALDHAHRSGVREVTPAEWLAARNAMNTALETFEQVNAGAGAWPRRHEAGE